MDYNKLLEKARKVYAECVTNAEKRRLESIFPELAESKGERIRKDIISYLQHESQVKRFIGDKEYERWIAWLEKQEQLTTDEYKQGKEDVLWCIKQARKNAKDENDIGTCWFAENWVEKQSEQNLVLSEEDKKQLERAIYMMEQLNMTKSWDDVYNWLKSLNSANLKNQQSYR